MADRGREILEQLLRERTPEERERLSQAWERIASGDPDSLPVLYALSDRFSLEAHAALLGEIRTIHASLEGMAREIGHGASVTVARTEEASKAALDHAARFAELIPKLERIVTGQETAATRSIKTVAESADRVSRELKQAKQHYDRTDSWRMTVFIALIFALVVGTGFLVGGKLYEWREVERLRALLHRSDRGDKEASAALWEEIHDYRERHAIEKPKPE